MNSMSNINLQKLNHQVILQLNLQLDMKTKEKNAGGDVKRPKEDANGVVQMAFVAGWDG